jgi:methionyl-tRNA formyltransferase
MTAPQTLVFAGTPEFAKVALQALHAAGHRVPLVLTQPDRPAGRGMALQASPVKQFALDHSLPVCQPRSLRLDGKFPDEARAAQAALLDARDAQGATGMVVAAYGLILPQWVLDVFGPASCAQGWGCLNIHASLLPRWRGAAPIHRAIEAGDAQTGITIMQMDAGLDTGDMLRVASTPIWPDETTGQLHDRLAAMGGALVVGQLRDAREGHPVAPVPQPKPGQPGADRITYAAKIDKAEARIDWSQPAQTLARRVRALRPAPGASMVLQGELWKLWAAQALDTAPAHQAPPGEVLAASDQGMDVATGQGVLRATELQRPGGKRLPVSAVLRGMASPVGLRLS